MIISFNTGKISGGGSTPEVNLQDKKINIVSNGLDVFLPDPGYDGFSTVYVKSYVADATGAKDFTQIGYSEDESIMLNTEIDDAIAYSKELKLSCSDDLNYLNQQSVSNKENLVYAPAFTKNSAKSLSKYFEDCKCLTYVPLYDTSNVTDMSYMFKGCTTLNTVPQFDTSNVTDMRYMFDGCSSLTSVPQFNISNVTDMRYMFQSCKSLNTVPQFDTSNVTEMGYMFSGCISLAEVPVFSLKNYATDSSTIHTIFANCSKLVKCGGFVDCENIKFSTARTNGVFYNKSQLSIIEQMGTIKNSISFNMTTNLTNESVQVVFDALYDYTGNGETTSKTVWFSSSHLNKIPDELKSIATSKGWKLST